MADAERSPAYSFRDDPNVPEFDDGHPIVFMDAECALCTRAARIIARLDRAGDFKICPVQTPLGRAVFAHYDLEPGDPDSWIFLEDGRAHQSLDAVIRAGRRLGGWGRLALVFAILPPPARRWTYRRIARSRYSLFGRADMCAVPDPELRARLME